MTDDSLSSLSMKSKQSVSGKSLSSSQMIFSISPSSNAQKTLKRHSNNNDRNLITILSNDSDIEDDKSVYCGASTENVKRKQRDHEDIIPTKLIFNGKLSKKDKYDFFTKEQLNQQQATIMTDLFQWHPPQVLNILESEEELLGSIDKISRDIKKGVTEEDEDLRNLKDEGFCVDNGLNLSKKTISILEARLFNATDYPDKKWFNSEGKLQFQSNPVISRSIKPHERIKFDENIIYKSANRRMNDSNIEDILVVNNKNLIELSFADLTFNHHHLFSLEHVLQEKLRQTHKNYVNLIESNILEHLKNQLSALRHSRNLTRQDNNDKIVILNDMKKLRENLFKHAKKQRDQLKAILNIWKEIKDLRIEQNYSNTSIRLIIRKDTSDSLTKKDTYEELFKEILEDIIEERKYNDTASNLSNGEGANTIESELKEVFEKCFKSPDEPNLFFILTYDNEITNENKQESNRHKLIKSVKFKLKIYCNGIFVCKSKYFPLNDNFLIEFDEAFSISLNESISTCFTVVVNEYKGTFKKQICELNIEVPNQNGCYSNVEKKESFHYKFMERTTDNGYDIMKIMQNSGIRNLKFIKLHSKDLINNRGSLCYKIQWRNNNYSTNGKAVAAEYPVSNILNKWNAVDKNQLELWLKVEQPDPQDPKNSTFYEYIKSKQIESISLASHKESDEDELKYFRLNPFANNEIMDFCKKQYLLENQRFLCLTYRNNNEIEFENISIPNKSKEIPLDILNRFKLRKTHEDKEETNTNKKSLYTRNNSINKLKEIYRNAFRQSKRSINILNYDSVIDERYLNYFEQLIKTTLLNWLNWFTIVHPNKPLIKVPLPPAHSPFSRTATVALTDSVPVAPIGGFRQNKLIIKIIKAKNIPKRIIQQSNKDNSNDDDDNWVKPFLKVLYEESIYCSKIYKGTNPIWNEVLEIPLVGNHDYMDIDSFSNSITINLFDRINEEDSENGDCAATTNGFWLGQIKIPLHCVANGTYVKGWFKVNTPEILFGYEIGIAQSDQFNQTQNRFLSNHDYGTYIYLELNLLSNIPLLEMNITNFPSNDPSYIIEYIHQWNEVFNSTFPSRKFNVFVIDSKMNSNCIIKHLKPIGPSQSNNKGSNLTIMECLNYISLIPFSDYNQFCENVCLTTDQLLMFMTGSILDHSIALTCFLMALKLDVWLLLGFGIPQGHRSYVLIKEYSKDSKEPLYSILDVVENCKVYLADPHCPLQSVYCLINGENVWGNAQRSSDNLAFLRFNLSRNSDWWPLFHANENYSAAINSVNNEINFMSLNIDSSIIKQLERRIERKLRRKLSNWRVEDETIFNHRLSDTFKNVLKNAISNRLIDKGKTQELFTNEVAKIATQHTIYGIIFKIQFTSIESIVNRLQQINLHLIKCSYNENWEFILAVHVESFPGGVLCVWIVYGNVS